MLLADHGVASPGATGGGGGAGGAGGSGGVGGVTGALLSAVVHALIAGSAATCVFRLVQGRMLRTDQRSAASGQKANRQRPAAPQLSVVRGAESAAAR